MFPKVIVYSSTTGEAVAYLPVNEDTKYALRAYQDLGYFVWDL
jgi:hypothetical protein